MKHDIWPVELGGLMLLTHIDSYFLLVILPTSGPV